MHTFENEVGEFRCTKCCEVLPRTAFYKDKREKNGIRARCKKCVSITYAHYEKSEKGIRAKARYRQSLKAKDTWARYRQSPKAREVWQNYRKSQKGRNATTSYEKMKYQTDAAHRMKSLLRGRLRNALKRAVGGVSPKKSDNTMNLLGCSIEYFMKHMEQQFKPGMTWERFGKFHIDHIKPCAAFDLRDPEQQKICFHYSNMQPLWPTENLKKGAKF